MSFDGVDAQLAREYGEGERTLVWWRELLWNYYVAECADLARQPGHDMSLMCKRFRVIDPDTCA